MRRLVFAGLLTFLVVFLSIQDAWAAQTVSKGVSFKWEETLDIAGTSLPLKVLIPATLSIQNLPDTAEPGKEIGIQAAITLGEGATVTVNEQTFQIGESVKRAGSEVREFDLSSVKPLVEQVLTDIIQAQLKMGKEQAQQLAAALLEYTQLSLVNQVVVKTRVDGPGSHAPRDLTLWVDAPGKGTVRIDASAKDGDTVHVTYECYWALLLKLGVSKDVYDNPALTPLITKLTQLIGLPLQKTLGEKKADGALTHTITVRAPIVLTPKLIAEILAVIAVIVVVAILLIVKFPRKPRWE